jgi:CheY-like chemotaxis protein
MAGASRDPEQKRLRILLVDDDQVIHYAATAFLVREGHEVESVLNGAQGLERFKAGDFDLVITDWAMPEMSGDQLAAAVKKISPGTPIIMLTGFADTGPAPSPGAGVDLVLGKPFTLGELRKAISQVTDSAR